MTAGDHVVRGRVVWATEGRLLVEDDHGTHGLSWGEAREAMIGAFAELVVASGEEPPRVVRGSVGAPPSAAFPRHGGDWRAFHDGERVAIRRLRERARALRVIRSYFDAEDFLEVETPIAVPSPGLDVHLDALEVRGLGAPRWLVTSPEYQMKRLLAAGLTRVVQLTKCFRRDERGARHEPEFTMLEWYRGFAGADALMGDTEQLTARVARELRGTTHVRIEALGARSDGTDLDPPWPRMTVDEALWRHAGIGLAELLPDEERFYRVWSHEVEPALGFAKPVFIVDWPASMASLARLHPDRPAFADRFEAYVAGVELSNGFGELIDAAEQRARLERDQAERRARGLPVYPIDERFLGALEEGLPPCAGNALGVDRLVALLVGAPRVADVITFGSERL